MLKFPLKHNVETCSGLILLVHDLFTLKLQPLEHLNLSLHLMFILAFKIRQLHQKLKSLIDSCLFLPFQDFFILGSGQCGKHARWFTFDRTHSLAIIVNQRQFSKMTPRPVGLDSDEILAVFVEILIAIDKNFVVHYLLSILQMLNHVL